MGDKVNYRDLDQPLRVAIAGAREDHEPGNITAGTSILLPGGLTYVVGTKVLKVYWNGRLMREGATKDYQEVDTIRIKFNFDLIVTDNIDYIT